jgi:decaprenylphospho-beta-D-erythro-pentofuranosid-2-ulose 2-reductase
MTGISQRIVVLGAASAIAEVAARLWAARGASFVLVGRDEGRLRAIAADLTARGAGHATTCKLDCARADARAELERMRQSLGGLDILLVAYGVLGVQAELERDPGAAAQLIQTNFTSAAAWCLAASAIFEEQRSGTLLVIGSVAGDRGRRSNFLYGATKGGLARLVEGVDHKLAALGGRAVIIKAGFVDTPMTAGFMKSGALWSTPDRVARIIVRAGDIGGPVVYAPAFWRLIILIIRHLPSFIFNKLDL